jgi:hypothetical protein
VRARGTAGLLLLLGALIVLALPQAAVTAPPPPPTGSCSPGPADCFAWHTGSVRVTWAAPPPGVVASGCAGATISTDTAGVPVGCTWVNAVTGEATGTTVVVRRDGTPPSVTASPNRGPDANGWYNHEVAISFGGRDNLSGIATCTGASYKGPDSGRVVVPGSCTDIAGNRAGSGFELKYDATPPTVEAKPNRQPDSHGWYNHALTVAFVGTDPVSSVDTCSASVQYKGPDSPGTSLSGSCRDKAANQSQSVSFALKYDMTPPKLGRVKAEVGERGILLKWTTSKDTSSVTVLRRPGLRAGKPSTVYSGNAATFTDRRGLTSGVKYRYTIAAYDDAGNADVKGLAVLARGTTAKSVARPKGTGAKPTSRPAVKLGLTAPAAGARVTAPPLLRWTPAPNATYYNLQLFRGGRKILTVWPSQSSYALKRSWTYRGQKFVLTPGHYRWYVWPGLGKRSQGRYGQLLGTRDFVVAG